MEPARKSVQERVYRILRQEIMDFTIKPGTLLSAKDVSVRISEQVGISISRTPVREAFIRLAKEGLLNIEPQYGTIVSLIDLSSVHQERFVRATLERANLEPFIETAQPDDYRRLWEKVAEQVEAIDREDYVGFTNLDNLFHRIFFSVTGNLLCIKLLSEYGGHYDRIRMMTTWNSSDVHSTILQHKELLTRLENGNLEGALRTLTHHLTKLNQEEIELTARFPNYFLPASTSQNSIENYTI